MIALLSPAKTLDFKSPDTAVITSSPELIKETKRLLPELQKLSVEEVRSLMKLSEKLATLNVERYQEFQTAPRAKKARAALLAFKGDVYHAFDLDNYSKRDCEKAQKSIRILSGLYGVLRPFDRIFPYRLEMKTPLAVGESKNLYQFWGNRITQSLNHAISETKASTVVNLASQEYAKSVQFRELNAPVVNVDFKEIKGGKPKIVALYAKRARGEMANYIVKQRLSKVEELKKFRETGYSFSKKLSSDSHYIFTRNS